jgi:DNA helicase HerA-like ATPase
MQNGLYLAGKPEPVFFLPAMANRHGLVAGATGTGKTVTLRVLAEAFSSAGIPVFLADIKGDLAGLPLPGEMSGRIRERVDLLGLAPWNPEGFPTVFWDLFGESGHSVRTTITGMGPLLLARLLQLNETQTHVLQLVFRFADEEGLLLLDVKDLAALLRHVSANAKSLRIRYGNLSPQSLGAIHRSLSALEASGGGILFGEPALSFEDLLQTAPDGRGYIHVLQAARLFRTPRTYATVLLWMLAALFEELPEVGDMEKPKLVFFFDEAHLLFSDLPRPVLEKVEQVVRLIRSKGVGIFFVTQSPADVPEAILGQLGNRVQHALRAFTPKDQRAVKSTAASFRQNPGLSLGTVLTELAVGEALVSFLDESGIPGVVERVWIAPPRSLLGTVAPSALADNLRSSPLAGKYDQIIDRESAYEILERETLASINSDDNSKSETVSNPTATKTHGGSVSNPRPVVRESISNPSVSKRSRSDSPAIAMLKSTLRSLGTTLGRELARGILGSTARRRR